VAQRAAEHGEAGIAVITRALRAEHPFVKIR